MSAGKKEKRLVSIGPRPFAGLAPVFWVGTYDSRNRANIMTAAMGGLCCLHPPCLSVSVDTSSWTHGAISERRAFTVSIPDQSLVREFDFCGLVSGRDEDKFSALGLTPGVGEHVDAPYVEECPVVIELLLRHSLPLGSHTQFVGEIMDVKIRPECLNSDLVPEPEALRSFCFYPMSGEYYDLGRFLARAFAVGKTLGSFYGK